MSGIPEFFEQYRQVFVSLDRDALLEVYAYPVHVVSTTDDGAMVSVFDRQEWSSILDGLLGAYRKIGIAAGEPAELESTQLTDNAASVRIRWHLRRDDGSPVYDIAAVYTVVRTDGAWHVVALAHDELPKLTAALEGDLSGW